MPAGGSGLSFGLAIGGNGALTTDDYGLVAAHVPPVTGRPGAGGWLSLQTLLIGAAVLIVLFLYLRGARTAVGRRLRLVRAGGRKVNPVPVVEPTDAAPAASTGGPPKTAAANARPPKTAAANARPAEAATPADTPADADANT